jgi:hypothetical protein
MPTRDGGNGSVQVRSVDGCVLVTIHGPGSTGSPGVSLSPEAVQELIAALVQARATAVGPFWSSSG